MNFDISWPKFVAPTKKILQPFKVGSRSAKYLPIVETSLAEYMLNFILLAIFPENFILIGQDLDMRVASFVNGMHVCFQSCGFPVPFASLRLYCPSAASVIFGTAIWVSEANSENKMADEAGGPLMTR